MVAVVRHKDFSPAFSATQRLCISNSSRSRLMFLSSGAPHHGFTLHYTKAAFGPAGLLEQGKVLDEYIWEWRMPVGVTLRIFVFASLSSDRFGACRAENGWQLIQSPDSVASSHHRNSPESDYFLDSHCSNSSFVWVFLLSFIRNFYKTMYRYCWQHFRVNLALH